MSKVTLIVAVICLMLNFMICEIRFAFAFWRNGAGAPERGVNAEGKDILGEQWTTPGELTPSGMRMHYLLGTRNRNRWDGFLSSSFNFQELYVRSTDFNTTIMSVLSNLQGLYPSGTGSVLTPGQIAKALPPVTSAIIDSAKALVGSGALPNQIQLIPVHLMEKEGSYFFYYNMLKCAPLNDTFTSNAQLPQNLAILNKIKTNWGAKLKVALNLQDLSYLDNFNNVYTIVDSFVGAYVDDRALKSFTDAGIDLKLFLDDAYEFEIKNIFDYYNGDADLFVPKMISTPFIEDAFRWMDTRIANDKTGIGYTGYAAPKVALYSAHDLSIGAVQTVLSKAFGTKKLKTSFASSFIWELYRPDNVADKTKLTAADYTVKLTYNDENYLEISYEEFKNKVQPLLLRTNELSDFCGWTSPNTTPLEDPVPTSYIDATIVLSVLLFFAVIGLIILLILVLRKPKTVPGHQTVIAV